MSTKEWKPVPVMKVHDYECSSDNPWEDSEDVFGVQHSFTFRGGSGDSLKPRERFHIGWAKFAGGGAVRQKDDESKVFTDFNASIYVPDNVAGEIGGRLVSEEPFQKDELEVFANALMSLLQEKGCRKFDESVIAATAK